jgi:hypothetical protein
MVDRPNMCETTTHMQITAAITSAGLLSFSLISATIPQDRATLLPQTTVQ